MFIPWGWGRRITWGRLGGWSATRTEVEERPDGERSLWVARHWPKQLNPPETALCFWREGDLAPAIQTVRSFPHSCDTENRVTHSGCAVVLPTLFRRAGCANRNGVGPQLAKLVPRLARISVTWSVVELHNILYRLAKLLSVRTLVTLQIIWRRTLHAIWRGPPPPRGSRYGGAAGATKLNTARQGRFYRLSCRAATRDQ
jgi:hypothetical protein